MIRTQVKMQGLHGADFTSICTGKTCYYGPRPSGRSQRGSNTLVRHYVCSVARASLLAGVPGLVPVSRCRSAGRSARNVGCRHLWRSPAFIGGLPLQGNTHCLSLVNSKGFFTGAFFQCNFEVQSSPCKPCMELYTLQMRCPYSIFALILEPPPAVGSRAIQLLRPLR